MPEHEPTILDDPTFLVTSAAGWEAEAQRELQAVLPGAHMRRLFMKGNLLVTAPGSVEQALCGLSEAETEVIAHVVPLQLRTDIGAGREHLHRLAQAAGLLPAPDPALTFRVSCHRRGNHDFSSREIELAVAEVTVHAGGPRVDLDSPQQILSVEVFQDLAFMGLSPAEHLLTKPLKRMRRYAPGQRPISRAEHKLREIIHGHGLKLPPNGRALDLGAAPGGWTRVLAEAMAEVVAVDPADLDERVAELPNVQHLRLRAEELCPAELGQFDLICNDINRDPEESAELLCRLAPLLRPGGLAVMTIKFVTRRRAEHVQQATEILSRAYEDIRVQRVPHNAKETSAVMRRSRTA
jgi:tRNA(Ser,Leu) C12 N-acetylase TAN1